MEEIRGKIAGLKRQYTEAAKATFAEKSAELFASNPELISFGWTQYTPYFNDGDTCEFSAHTDDPDINGFSYYGDESDEIDGVDLNSQARETVGYPEKPNPDFSPRAKQVVEAVKAFLAVFDQDYLLDAFGDHQKITVKRSGVTTADYEHD